jgi:hypothetical protein
MQLTNPSVHLQVFVRQYLNQELVDVLKKHSTEIVILPEQDSPVERHSCGVFLARCNRQAEGIFTGSLSGDSQDKHGFVRPRNYHTLACPTMKLRYPDDLAPGMRMRMVNKGDAYYVLVEFILHVCGGQTRYYTLLGDEDQGLRCALGTTSYQ